MANVLLTSENYIKKLTNISDNVQGGYIGVALREAQEIDLQAIIGKALLEKVKKLVEDNSIEDVLNKEYKALLDNYIQPYLSYATITKLIMMAAIKIDNMGVNQATDENINNLTLDETFRLQDYYQTKVDYYCKRLQEHIVKNADLFPEINGNSCNEMQANLYSSASSGLFLGGARGKMSHKSGLRTYAGGSGSGSGGGMTPEEVQRLIDAALAFYTKTADFATINLEPITNGGDFDLAAKEWVEAKQYITGEDALDIVESALTAYTPTANFATINGSGITDGGNIVIDFKEKNYQIVNSLDDVIEKRDGVEAYVPEFEMQDLAGFSIDLNGCTPNEDGLVSRAIIYLSLEPQQAINVYFQSNDGGETIFATMRKRGTIESAIGETWEGWENYFVKMVDNVFYMAKIAPVLIHLYDQGTTTLNLTFPIQVSVGKKYRYENEAWNLIDYQEGNYQIVDDLGKVSIYQEGTEVYVQEHIEEGVVVPAAKYRYENGAWTIIGEGGGKTILLSGQTKIAEAYSTLIGLTADEIAEYRVLFPAGINHTGGIAFVNALFNRIENNKIYFLLDYNRIDSSLSGYVQGHREIGISADGTYTEVQSDFPIHIPIQINTSSAITWDNNKYNFLADRIVRNGNGNISLYNAQHMVINDTTLVTEGSHVFLYAEWIDSGQTWEAKWQFARNAAPIYWRKKNIGAFVDDAVSAVTNPYDGLHVYEKAQTAVTSTYERITIDPNLDGSGRMAGNFMFNGEVVFNLYIEGEHESRRWYWDWEQDGEWHEREAYGEYLEYRCNGDYFDWRSTSTGFTYVTEYESEEPISIVSTIPVSEVTFGAKEFISNGETWEELANIRKINTPSELENIKNPVNGTMAVIPAGWKKIMVSGFSIDFSALSANESSNGLFYPADESGDLGIRVGVSENGKPTANFIDQAIKEGIWYHKSDRYVRFDGRIMKFYDNGYGTGIYGFDNPDIIITPNAVFEVEIESNKAEYTYSRGEWAETSEKVFYIEQFRQCNDNAAIWHWWRNAKAEEKARVKCYIKESEGTTYDGEGIEEYVPAKPLYIADGWLNIEDYFIYRENGTDETLKKCHYLVRGDGYFMKESEVSFVMTPVE